MGPLTPPESAPGAPTRNQPRRASRGEAEPLLSWTLRIMPIVLNAPERMITTQSMGYTHIQEYGRNIKGQMSLTRQDQCTDSWLSSPSLAY